MNILSRHIVTAGLASALAAGCAGSKETQKTEATANATGTQAPASSAAALGAPDPGLGQGAQYSLDVRGAFGPVVFSHADVMPDGKVTCRRRLARETAERVGAFTLTAADKAALDEVAKGVRLAEVKPAAREAKVQDVGTTTLSQAVDRGVARAVLNSDSTTAPPVDDLLLMLVAFQRTCEETAPVPAAPAESPQ